jgi:hypothetical protein
MVLKEQLNHVTHDRDSLQEVHQLTEEAHKDQVNQLQKCVEDQKKKMQDLKTLAMSKGMDLIKRYGKADQKHVCRFFLSPEANTLSWRAEGVFKRSRTIVLSTVLTLILGPPPMTIMAIEMEAEIENIMRHQVMREARQRFRQQQQQQQQQQQSQQADPAGPQTDQVVPLHPASGSGPQPSDEKHKDDTSHHQQGHHHHHADTSPAHAPEPVLELDIPTDFRREPSKSTLAENMLSFSLVTATRRIDLIAPDQATFDLWTTGLLAHLTKVEVKDERPKPEKSDKKTSGTS